MLQFVLVIAWVAVKLGINTTLFPVNAILDDCTYPIFSSAMQVPMTNITNKINLNTHHS